MLVGKISYFMPNILGNDDVMISYKLPILDVVKCARISLPDHLFLFWYYHSEKSFKCSISMEICVRSVFPGPDPAPNLVLDLSWSWSFWILSGFHPSRGSDLILVLVLIPSWSWLWFWSYLTSIRLALVFRFHPGVGPVSGPGYSLTISR